MSELKTPQVIAYTRLHSYPVHSVWRHVVSVESLPTMVITPSVEATVQELVVLPHPNLVNLPLLNGDERAWASK